MAQRLRLTFPLNPVIWFLILLSLPLNIVIQIKFTKSRVYIFAVVEIGHQFLFFFVILSYDSEIFNFRSVRLQNSLQET